MRSDDRIAEANQERQIVLAGATGDLGERILRALLARKTRVRAIVRRGAANASVKALHNLGVEVAEVSFDRPAELERACADGACVISALSGLDDVIQEAQGALLKAAVAVGVPRFFPSDFSSDFMRLPAGHNRNLDLRRSFHERLEQAEIASTGIFCGAFADLLLGKAPIVLFKLRRVLYWADADQPLDFTTKDDVAAFTAAAALDDETPEALHVAGDRISARQISQVLSEITGHDYPLVKGGSLRRLELLSKATRAAFPGGKALYPAWQGMQYLHDMFSGWSLHEHLDNARYPDIRWTSARDVLARQLT